MVFALCCSVLITPSLCFSGWRESNMKYWPVCVGLKYMLTFKCPLLLMAIWQSKKASLPFFISSLVNLMIMWKMLCGTSWNLTCHPYLNQWLNSVPGYNNRALYFPTLFLWLQISQSGWNWGFHSRLVFLPLVCEICGMRTEFQEQTLWFGA